MENVLHSQLENWKNSIYLNNDQVLKTFTIQKNETDISTVYLKISTIVTDMGQTEKVAVSQKLVVDSEHYKAENVIQNIKNSIETLETKFAKQCKTAYQRLASRNNSEDYIDRNPYA